MPSERLLVPPFLALTHMTVQWRARLNSPPTVEHFLRVREMLSTVSGAGGGRGGRKSIRTPKAQTEQPREFETENKKAALCGSLDRFSNTQDSPAFQKAAGIPPEPLSLSSSSKPLEVPLLALHSSPCTCFLLEPFAKTRKGGWNQQL